MPSEFEIVFTNRALNDLRHAAEWIATQSPELAQRWTDGFKQKLLLLQSNPRRYEIARESSFRPVELRQLLYGRRRNYRAIFQVLGQQVIILAVRHAAQDDLNADDLF